MDDVAGRYSAEYRVGRFDQPECERAERVYQYIYNAVQSGTSFKEMAYEIVTATGNQLHFAERGGGLF